MQISHVASLASPPPPQPRTARLTLTLSKFEHTFCGHWGGIEQGPAAAAAAAAVTLVESGTDDHRGAMILTGRLPTGRKSLGAAGCVSCCNRSAGTESGGQLCPPHPPTLSAHPPPPPCHVLNVLCRNGDNLFKSAHGAEARDAFSSVV